MGDLARIRSGDRLDVLRPFPSRLECALGDVVTGQLHDLRSTLPLELAGLVGRVEILYLGCHWFLPSFEPSSTVHPCRQLNNRPPSINLVNKGATPAWQTSVSIARRELEPWPSPASRRVRGRASGPGKRGRGLPPAAARRCPR